MMMVDGTSLANEDLCARRHHMCRVFEPQRAKVLFIESVTISPCGELGEQPCPNCCSPASVPQDVSLLVIQLKS
jgi:hypothetical protein